MWTPPVSPDGDLAPSPSLKDFAPTEVRYIKLGAGGSWAEQAFADGIVPTDLREVPHELCSTGDWELVRTYLRGRGTKASTASNWTRELRDFYEQDERCLWFTIANGHLY